MATPLSNSTSYCTPGDFIQFYDVRRVGDLLLDIGARGEAEAIKSGNTLPEASVTQLMLDAASGEVEGACLVAQLYAPADLAGLTGVSNKRLKKIIADIAFWYLLCRRKQCDPTPQATLALQALDDLRNGRRIFGILEVAEAGFPTEVVETATEIENANFATMQGKPFFGTRANELRG